MKLFVLTVLCLTFAVTASPQLGSILWNGKSANTVISIHRLAMNAVSLLTSCTEEKTPNPLTFRDANDCVNRCPGHCTGLFANCNATCVMGNRCVCGQSQYCLINFDRVNEDGTYGHDCYDLTAPELQP